MTRFDVGSVVRATAGDLVAQGKVVKSEHDRLELVDEAGEQIIVSDLREGGMKLITSKNGFFSGRRADKVEVAV